MKGKKVTSILRSINHHEVNRSYYTKKGLIRKMSGEKVSATITNLRTDVSTHEQTLARKEPTTIILVCTKTDMHREGEIEEG